jgi:anti-anti-sigma factor
MSGPNHAEADGTRSPSGPDADAAVPDGLRAGRVVIEVESAPGAATIVIRGELDLVTMPFLAEQLTLISRDKPGRLVFDLAGTAFMDCGSARLIAGAGRWLPDGRRPVIRRPGRAVRRVFDLTGLDACCEIEALVAGSIRPGLFAEAKEDAGVGR